MSTEELTLFERLYKVSGHIDDILMFPMFATIIMESSGAGAHGLNIG